MYVTDSMNMGRITSVPKSALYYEGQMPRSGNLLFPSLVLPELTKVGRELNFLLRSSMLNEIDDQYVGREGK